MTSTVTAGRAARRPVLGVAIAALAVAVIADPGTTHVPLCPLHSATGLYCPLCGGLRAVHALSRGAVTTALRDNAMVVAAIALGPVVALCLRTMRPNRGRRVRRYAAMVLFAAAIIFAIVRNLPFATALRPA